MIKVDWEKQQIGTGTYVGRQGGTADPDPSFWVYVKTQAKKENGTTTNGVEFWVTCKSLGQAGDYIDVFDSVNDDFKISRDSSITATHDNVGEFIDWIVDLINGYAPPTQRVDSDDFQGFTHTSVPD